MIFLRLNPTKQGHRISHEKYFVKHWLARNVKF